MKEVLYMEDNKKIPLSENILRRIANTLAKYQTFDPPPADDSAIQTRKEQMPSGTGFGASLRNNAGSWYDEQMHLDPARIV